MARVKVNPLLLAILGQVGDLVLKERYGSVYLSRKPVFKPREGTDAQKAARERFRRATRYAKTVMADPAARAPYETAARENNRAVKAVIIADFLNGPSVDEIDLSCYDGTAGSRIAIRATDDFDVTGVEVAISTAAGEELERGNAVLSSMRWGRWVYTAVTSVQSGTRVTVRATATDRPGNTAGRSEVAVMEQSSS